MRHISGNGKKVVKTTNLGFGKNRAHSTSKELGKRTIERYRNVLLERL